MLPTLSGSQNLSTSLPKWIKYDGLDAVVISIPQMDSISVAFMQRNFYKKKVESNKYRFDLLILDIEQLQETVNFKTEIIKDKDLIIKEKDTQISSLERLLELEKSKQDTLLEQLGKYGLVAIIAFVLGVVITL